jgi:uncharacterized protein YceK
MLAAMSGGCGSFVNQQEPGMYFALHDRQPRQPYGGVAVDFQSVREATDTSAFMAIDLPLSVAADTLLLPFDVFYTVRNWDRDVWAEHRADLDRRMAGRSTASRGEDGKPFEPVRGEISASESASRPLSDR